MFKKHLTPGVRRDHDGLAVIGRSLHDLRGIRHVEGENGSTPPAGDTPPASPPTPAPPAPAAPTPPPAQPPAPSAPPSSSARTPDQEYVTSLREEAKGYRIERDSEKQKREAAEQKLTDATTAMQNMRRDTTVTRIAGTVEGNADLLLDSESFKKQFAEVNLDDAEAVKENITKWLESHPAYKSGPSLPPASGGRPTGAGSPPAQPHTLGAAISAALGGNK